MKNQKVITWQAPNGKKISLCGKCEKGLAGNWPKTSEGQDYCQVSKGLHKGHCGNCGK